MQYSQKLSSHTSSEKRISHMRSSKALAYEDEEQCNANAKFSSASEYSQNTALCGYQWIESKQHHASTSSSLHDCVIFPSASTEHPDSSSSAIYNDTIHSVESSDESGSELNPNVGGALDSDVNDQMLSLQQNSSASMQASVSGTMNKKTADRDTRRYKGGRDSCMLNQGIRTMAPSATRSYGMANKSLVSDHAMPYDTASCNISHKFLRKGSSSKAPHIDDFTAPLGFDKRYRQSSEDVYQGGRGGLDFHDKRLSSKNRNAINASKITGQSSSTSDNNQITKNRTSFNSHRVRPTDLGQRNKGNVRGASHRGLSNIMCTSSSSSDVLPSVSATALNNLGCSSILDVLPSASGSAFSGEDHLRPRKNSRPFGVTEEGEASRGICLDTVLPENDSLFLEQSPEQYPYNPEFEPSPGLRVSTPFLQTVPSHDRIPVSVDPMINMINTNPIPPSGNRHLATNRSRGNQDRLSRNNGRYEYMLRPNAAFLEPIPAYREELSYPRGSRRSVYGNQHDVSRESNRTWSRNRIIPTSTGTVMPRMRESQHTMLTFSGPPGRPPPRTPLQVFSEPSILAPPHHATHDYFNAQVVPSIPLPNQETNGHDLSNIETMPFGSSIQHDEVRQHLTSDTLSEILSAWQDMEMGEELSYEQILMLEATILLGGVHLHDRHRDMRIDIDNMSYEELLALEERIGNVSTGLSEESIMKCVQKVRFVPPDNSIGCAPEEIAVKCTVCQDEFEEDVELGVLQCGHTHHLACIKQWLEQKNQCPVCKASVLGGS